MADEPFDNDYRTRRERTLDSALALRLRAQVHLDRRRLRDREFTVVANDCWGAEVYRYLGVPYNTPFVGGFLFAPCFLTLLGDLRGYLESPLEFTRESRYDFVNEHLAVSIAPRYAIGVLGGDVEVHFLHYHDEREALERFRRRVARVNYDRLFVKACSGKELWDRAHVERFDALDLDHKICLTHEPYPDLASAVPMRRYTTDGVLQFPRSRAQLDIVGWLNGDRDAVARARARTGASS
jgi:uncharacterized protein (DUF1919 family)